jgi:hypothetical protein
MRSYSTDYLHNKLKRHIDLAKAYAEVPELDFIIKSCRLKPYKILFENKENKISLFNLWCDEFGNTLDLNNKKLKITLNNLKLNKNKIVCTDIYFGLSIDKVYKFSKLIYIFCGKEEDLNSECAFIAFLGIDNYLRCFMYLYDEWINISPLYLGLNNLKLLSNNLDLKYFININNNYPIHCSTGKAWLSYCPISDEIKSELNRETNIILPTIFRKDTNKQNV